MTRTKKIKLDQYGQPVPDDLVIIEKPQDFTDEQLKQIDALAWYEPRGLRKCIFVSFKEMERIMGDVSMDFYDPEEFGFEHCNWNKIECPLHRWSETDGFYHA